MLAWPLSVMSALRVDITAAILAFSPHSLIRQEKEDEDMRATLGPLIRKCCQKLLRDFCFPLDWPVLCGRLRKLSDPHGGRSQMTWDLERQLDQPNGIYHRAGADFLGLSRKCVCVLGLAHR